MHDCQPMNKRFAHLLGNPEHADFWFHIKKDGIRVPVHKLIVGACSQVLHNIVYGANSDMSVEHCEYDLEEISGPAFMEVLRYMYTDEVRGHEMVLSMKSFFVFVIYF